MHRRRFLAVSALSLSGATLLGTADAAVWRGAALGADASITVEGESAERAIALATEALREAEALFDLYDPASMLAKLNRSGALASLPGAFAETLLLCNRLHRLTGGRFDPTVQPLWRTLAFGGDVARAAALVGWDRVELSSRAVRLGKGQALTLNGIAQGAATDLIAKRLKAAGFAKVLVEVGEHRGIGGPWRVELSDPHHGRLGQRTLHDGAIATSSPGALRLADGASHILDPVSGGTAPPRWSTVSVEASSAALADGLSTALCHLERSAIEALREELPEVTRITLVDAAGDLSTL